MAEAIIAGVLARGVAEAGSIVVGEPVLRRREYLSGRYGTRTVVDNHRAVEGADIVVIAVKPQQLAEVLEELSGSLNASQSILSIVAGASVQSISEGANHAAVIRVMPNTPAQVGQGMTVWTASPEVPEAHREAAGEIFDSLGTATYVAEEKYLDMATALSASGPAYVFLFLESLIDAGVHMGLPREMAQTLAPADNRGKRSAGQRVRQAPGRPSEHGDLSWRYHRGGAAGAGGCGFPGSRDERRHRRAREGAGAGLREAMGLLLNYLITLLIFAILGRVILDWLVVGGLLRYDNALFRVRDALIYITEPILAPIRRFTRMGMIDLSPMVAIILLSIFQQFAARI